MSTPDIAARRAQFLLMLRERGITQTAWCKANGSSPDILCMVLAGKNLGYRGAGRHCMQALGWPLPDPGSYRAPNKDWVRLSTPELQAIARRGRMPTPKLRYRLHVDGRVELLRRQSA